MNIPKKIFIVGGGLCGLTLSYLLSRNNISSTILEASSRLGGRIHTAMGALGTPLELGATWFTDEHKNLLALIDDLGLTKYPQFSRGISLFQNQSFEPPQEFSVPESEYPSYRLAGGTQMLIDALAHKLVSSSIRLNTRVTSIDLARGFLILKTLSGEIEEAGVVVLCIPPQLAVTQIQFSPKLDQEVYQLLPHVHTWMVGSVKFVLEYDAPFWRNRGYSGMVYSRSGIIAEMYDHTNFENTQYGFTGFLNGSAISYSQEARKELVLKQLEKLLGRESLQPSFYSDKVWTDDYVVAGNQFVQRPHQNNGHAMLQQSYLDKKLFFSSTESATQFGGYMEGAVISAATIANKILEV